MNMNLLYGVILLDTIILLVLIIFFYFYLLKTKKKKRQYEAHIIEEQETRNLQLGNFLIEMLGVACADAIICYQLKNGVVFLNNESEFKLAITNEKLEDYYEFKSVIRTHQPQNTSTYGLTYTELKAKKVLEVFADDSINKEYFQSNYCIISELKERGTHYAVLFYLQSPKDNAPFGMISLEYRKGENQWRTEKRSQNLYLSASYDCKKIVDKISFLLEGGK